MTTEQLAQSTIRKVSWRLVPFVALMFFINFLDRTAISFAGPNGMSKDLGLSAAQFGLAAGIFFIGYIVLEIPSNLALHKFGARRWLARIMVTWGVVALLFTWVSSVPGLYTLRFLLGVAEAGFFPGAILFLSMWVPARYRSHILALFYLAQPLTIVIGAPVAALLIGANGLFGLEGWRIMFFGVAIPAILVGVIAWFYLTDRPSQAKWLTAQERDWLTAELDREQSAKTGKTSHGNPLAAMTSGRVWVFSLMYFGLIYGLYALAFFLPTIIGGFETRFGTHFNVFQKGLITAIPYLPAAIALFLWSRDATKRGVRSWHIALPALIGAISVPLALQMSSPAASIAIHFRRAAEFLVAAGTLSVRCGRGGGHRADQYRRQSRGLRRAVCDGHGEGYDRLVSGTHADRRRDDADVRHSCARNRPYAFRACACYRRS
jgi:MFS family permease